MLHQVPLAGLRRIMTNYQADVQLVRKLLDVTLPGATPATVAAAAWAWPARTATGGQTFSPRPDL